MHADRAILNLFDNLSAMSQELLKSCAIMGHHFSLSLLVDLLPRAMKSELENLRLEFDSLIHNGWIQSDDARERVSRQFDASERTLRGHMRILKESDKKGFSINKDD